jgi:hypothetical protein
MRLAPILHDLAARLSGRPAQDARTQPMNWAYALRDAVGLAHPDVLVSHWDGALEADALRAGATQGGGDWVDRLLNAPRLADAAPTKETVELVKTLVGLFRTGPAIAASVTGPATVASALADELLGDDPSEDDRVELADLCADALAGLIDVYGEAGAAKIVVIEHAAGFLDAGDVCAAQSPLVRALGHHRVPGVVVAAEGLDLSAAGYEAAAARWDGSGPPPAVAILPPELWALPQEEFAERWRGLVKAAEGSEPLVLSDGPLPADMPLENLQLVVTASQSAP